MFRRRPAHPAACGGAVSTRALWIALCAALCLLLTPLARSAEPTHTLRIAAAADLQPVLPSILARYASETGIHGEAVFASSSTLASQILNGAPYDLFLSADFAFPQRVIAGGRAQQEQPIAYARGTLVLWTRKDAPILAGHPLSLDLLRNPGLKKIAIANPEHAPYGRAAVAAIKQIGLWPQLQSKLVIAENIAQAAQFVSSGNAEAGILSLTSAVTPRMEEMGSYVVLPSSFYPPILQGAVVIRGASGSRQAQQFLDFLRSKPIEQQLAQRGLRAP